MAPDDSGESIRRRMAELRRDLTCDVRDVGRSARELASPLYYIRHFPWASAAVAAAVGFMLVPKKKQVITPDPEMLAEMVRKQQVHVGTSKASAESHGLLKSLAVMGLTWGLRTGLAYMGQRLTSAAMNKANTAHEEPPSPAPSPLEEPWNTTR